MDSGIAMFLAPFMLALMLLIAKPFNWLAKKLLPEGRVKNFLLKARSNRSERMEAADQWVGDKFKTLFRRICGK
jgi:hypothetical protein